MNSFLTVLIVLSMISVVGVLALGIISMIRGGEFNQRNGNKLMQARVILHGFTIALLALAYFASHQ